MSSKKESVSERLLALLNPTPVQADPEAYIYEETSAKVVDKDDDCELSDNENQSLFRKQNVSLIEESDERYKGKKISRKSIAKSNWEESDNDEDEDGDNEGIEGSEDEGAPNDEDSEDHPDTNSTDDEDLSGKGTEDDEDDFKISLNQTQSDADSSFQHISKQDVSAEVEKGTAIRNQLSLCDTLLESRIQLQKSLCNVNKFPRLDTLTEFKSQGGNNFTTAIEQTKRSVKGLLDKLLDLQSEKLGLFSETHHIGKKSSIGEEDDDEVVSSSDEDDGMNKIKEKEAPQLKKRKLADYPALLDTRHQEFLDYRNSTIQKWNDKTRVAVGKVTSRSFSAFEQSIVRQIEQTMINRPRLIARTQLKRTAYRVLGNEAVTVCEPVEKLNTETMEDKSKEFDIEIFDDDDFYHQLLRELIERKAADVTDPMRLGRQWLELQKVRSKMKKKIDTRATKGRKIRFTEHAKLVNFMAPVAEILWNNEARGELYNSIFGKT